MTTTTQSGYKILIPRQASWLIQEQPKRFGFDDPDMAERFKQAVRERKRAVLRRLPGGLSGVMRAPYHHHNWNDGSRSRYSDTPDFLNKDPEMHRWGPTLTLRTQHEAQEVFKVMSRVLGFWRMEVGSHRGGAAEKQYRPAMCHLTQVLAKFRVAIFIPLWAEKYGAPIYEDESEYVEVAAAVEEWIAYTHLDSKQRLLSFAPDFPEWSQERRAYVFIPNALLGLAWMWADSAVCAALPHTCNHNKPNVWDQIFLHNQDVERGCYISFTKSEATEVQAKVDGLTADHKDEFGISEWKAIKLLTGDLEFLLLG